LLLLAAPATGVAAFAWFGLYRLVTRYITIRGSSRLLTCIGLSIMAWAMLALVFGALWIPRTVIFFLYPLIGGGLIFASRQIFAVLLRTVGVPLPPPGREPRTVVVYGAGRTGVQLLDALHNSGEARVVGFLDDTSSLWGQYAGGVKIYRPEKLDRLIEREGVKEVVLALPEAQRRERQQILKRLQRFPVRVKTLPSMEDFAAGRAAVSDLRPVDVEDLLGRHPAPADPALLARAIRGKSVLVTGAGGSIGSELVRQILRQGPSRMVLLELSEVALYEIEMEVHEIVESMGPSGDAAGEAVGRPQVVAVLGSVLDKALVRRVIGANHVATVFHAAAYKHVPIVESNPVAGLSNNTFGTLVVAQAARDLGVERFVLISTDKAVRPTNVMGASKRLAELVLQSHAADPRCRTVFTIVRFGNVLDSSGSVVRRFRRQIQAGGPVTVTHPDIVRYFMSIPEAAGLVLQAGAMAVGGEVFVLDMGEPVKIDELARSMVRLTGLEVRDESNPDGDVQIVYTGLRPGEKLYEELLIGANTKPTEHPLIRRSSEPQLTAEELERNLIILRSAMDEGSVRGIEEVLLRTVEGYQPSVRAAEEDKAEAPRPASRILH
jgi:FlaA1/EpsC-like NDP-sugar epimerase